MNWFSIKNEICEKDRKHIFVCGHSGSGKSTFSKMLAKELGYTYVNVDWLSLDICHEEDFLKVANKEIKDYIYDDTGNLLKKI